jgi:hypothetical protein
LCLEFVHLNRWHVDLYPEREHLKVAQAEHTIHVRIAHVENAQMTELEGKILGMLDLHELGDG